MGVAFVSLHSHHTLDIITAADGGTGVGVEAGEAGRPVTVVVVAEVVMGVREEEEEEQECGAKKKKKQQSSYSPCEPACDAHSLDVGVVGLERKA